MGLYGRLFPQSALSWRTMFSIEEADEFAAELRTKQFSRFKANVPLAVVTLITFATTTAAAFIGTTVEPIAWIWLAVIVTMVLGSGALVAGLEKFSSEERPRAEIMRLIALATLVGVLSFNSLALIVMSKPAAGPMLFTVASIQLAMIATGSILFAPIPIAALAFVGGFLLFYMLTLLSLFNIGLAPITAFGLPSVLGVVLLRAIVTNATLAANEVRQMVDARAHSDVIAMLLAEFEQNSRDWLWEIDADGRLIHVSARFAEMFGLSAEELQGRELLDAAWARPTDGAVSPIADAITARRTFRNIICPVVIEGEARWWSLSGSPRYDAAGACLGFIGVGSDVTEVRRSQEQIERMANSDGLTGLANRSVMRGRLQAALDAAKRNRGSCALIMLDLDRFKSINDTFGHQVGDELLRSVSERLLKVSGAHVTCARLGGDEFAIVLPDCSEARAIKTANRVVTALAGAHQMRGATVKGGASAGVALGPLDGETIDDIVRAADLALYQAKEDGRGITRRFEPALHKKAEQRRAMELALRSALTEDQLSLAFQPIYSLASGEVRGFEALLRWTHPEFGSIPPSTFIPIAEETGLIDSIGEWVIRTACAWAARWPEHVGIAVNLSPSQLINPRLPGVVLNALATHGIAPDRMELEITENVFLNEDEGTRSALAQLAALGVRLGLDDFGTGYSSLGYLRNSIFSTIKIDRMFVRDAVDAGSQSAEIVRHIVSLANHLGMDTVAEGAETSDELDAVRQLGCGSVQGYFTGRPMTPADAMALVGSRSVAQAA